MDEKQQIIKIITDMSGRHAPSIIFADWVHCAALAIQNSCQMIHDRLWSEREQEYIALMKQYTPEEQQQMFQMFALLTYAFDADPADLLGEIYMESGCGNKGTGQFFTPFHLSRMTADLLLDDDVSEEKPVILDEPSAGSGGMILAVALALKKKGINYQRCMKVRAQDLDWRSVYMTYVQLSLLEIDAVVVQGDSLAGGKPEPKQIFRTPRRMGALL